MMVIDTVKVVIFNVPIQLPLNASESEQLRLASLEDGYYICLNKLLSLQHYVEDAQELEATFEER